MYKAEMIIDNDVIIAKRELAKAAPGLFANYVNTIVKPDVMQQVNTLFVPYPGPVSKPFEFATPKSRAYYFWKFKGKIPYQRTGGLGQSWFVTADNRKNDGFIIFGNSSTIAAFVFGPGFAITRQQQVPGHRNTGWGQDFERKVIEVSERTNQMLIDGWLQITMGQA